MADFRLAELDDFSISVNGEYIGAIVCIKVDIDYEYSKENGLNQSKPYYDIVIAYRPIISTRFLWLERVSDGEIIINEPWGTRCFYGCKTRTYNRTVDKDGLIETVRFKAASTEYV